MARCTADIAKHAIFLIKEDNSEKKNSEKIVPKTVKPFKATHPAKSRPKRYVDLLKHFYDYEPKNIKSKDMKEIVKSKKPNLKKQFEKELGVNLVSPVTPRRLRSQKTGE